MIELNGKKARVCVDPGHGGHDSGAIGPSGVRESEIALKLSKEVMFQLDDLGIDSYLTRTEDEFISLSGRVEESVESDCMVSIHCNAHTSQAQGIETIYDSSAGRHKALANYVQQSLIKHCQGHRDRGIKMSPSDAYPRKLFVLSAAKVPTCLTEVEFISHVEWEKWLDSDEGQNQIAFAIAQGIKSFLMSLPGAKMSDDRKTERLSMTTKAAPKSEEPIEVQQAPVMEAGAAGQLAEDTAKRIVDEAKISISEPSNEEAKIEVAQKKASGTESSGGSKGSGLKRKSKRKSKR